MGNVKCRIDHFTGRRVALCTRHTATGFKIQTRIIYRLSFSRVTKPNQLSVLCASVHFVNIQSFGKPNSQSTKRMVRSDGTTTINETTEAENPFHLSLVRQMIQAARASGNSAVDNASINENLEITNEALVAAGEVLRLFVKEAWHRASIEAECEYEGAIEDATTFGSASDNQTKITTTAPIRADHITKIAAELLMDFS